MGGLMNGKGGVWINDLKKWVDGRMASLIDG